MTAGFEVLVNDNVDEDNSDDEIVDEVVRVLLVLEEGEEELP